MTAITEPANKNIIGLVDDFQMNPLHILCSNPNVSPQMISELVTVCPSLLSMRNIEDMTPLMMFMKCKGIVVSADEKNERAVVTMNEYLDLQQSVEESIESMLSMGGNEVRSHQVEEGEELSGLHVVQSFRLQRDCMRRQGVTWHNNNKCMLTVDDEMRSDKREEEYGVDCRGVERSSLQHCIQQGVAWKNIECMLAMDNEMRSELHMKDEETGLYPYMEIASASESYDLETLYRLLQSHPYWLVEM